MQKDTGATPYAVLLSSASADSCGPDLVSRERFARVAGASEHGATIAAAQPGIRYAIMRQDAAGVWVDVMTGLDARATIAARWTA